jgi:hypothetical protein
MSTFPFETWRRISMRHALKTSIREVDYRPAAGVPALRDAICLHLRRSRAVVCDSSEVIVVSGAQQALDLVTRILVDRGGPHVKELQRRSGSLNGPPGQLPFVKQVQQERAKHARDRVARMT